MKIKLLKNHCHGGVNYVVGDVLDVDVDTSNWLANLKVATPVSGETSLNKAPKSIPPHSVSRGAPVVTEPVLEVPSSGKDSEDVGI